MDSNLKDYLKCVLLARHVHQHEKLFRKQLDNGETKQFPLIKSLAEMGKKVSHTSFTNRETDGNFLFIFLPKNLPITSICAHVIPPMGLCL
jgi:hypothetical protein